MRMVIRVNIVIIMTPNITNVWNDSVSSEKKTNICKCVVIFYSNIKLMKGKALRKHSLHEKTAASVLLKLFISSNE